MVLSMDREKNGNAEKTAVCLLQLNMQQLWGGTVRRGMQDAAVSGWMCSCVADRMVACECVCVCEQM